MDRGCSPFEKLKAIAIAEFKIAADRGVPSPVGMAVLLRSQFILSAHNGLEGTVRDMVEQCLFYPHQHVPATTLPEDVPADLEIAKICITRKFDPDKLIEPQVDKAIKDKLAASPCTTDGQMVYVVHPTLDETRIFKL